VGDVNFNVTQEERNTNDMPTFDNPNDFSGITSGIIGGLIGSSVPPVLDKGVDIVSDSITNITDAVTPVNTVPSYIPPSPTNVNGSAITLTPTLSNTQLAGYSQYERSSDNEQAKQTSKSGGKGTSPKDLQLKQLANNQRS
jgi:hypothetical protein